MLLLSQQTKQTDPVIETTQKVVQYEISARYSCGSCCASAYRLLVKRLSRVVKLCTLRISAFHFKQKV